MANKIILGHDEVAYHLTWHALRHYFRLGPRKWNKVGKIYNDYYSRNREDIDIHSQEFQDRVYKSVSKDLSAWVEWVKYLRVNFQKLSHLIEAQIPVLDKQLGKGDKDKGRRTIYRLINKGIMPSFSKTLGRRLLTDADYVFPSEYTDADDVFLRNIINNDDILMDRMRNHKPFWFVDSGYTNFIHGGNKRFHRVMRNDLHHGDNGNVFPPDRLSMFDSFPQPWRTGGDKILVIEPSKYICQLYGIGIHAWREDVKAELAKHTNMEVIWREKEGDRKTRSNLYRDLVKDKSIHCVVHYNSNAGTEAIWAGVPVITLGKHVTQSVSKNKLSDINDLYRGSLGDWLCYLSYSQFEFDELMNGHAVKILRKYYNV